MALTCSDGRSWSGGKKSYSMAYPGRVIFACCSPGIACSTLICTSTGSEVESPFTYNSCVSNPSGSRNT